LIADGTLGTGAGDAFSSKLAVAVLLAMVSAAMGSVAGADETVGVGSSTEAGAGLSS
jgi:hypothetical protein